MSIPSQGFFCRTCGEFHPELPMDFGMAAPDYYFSIPEKERSVRCQLTPDLCVIDEEYFFIRGCLEVPVIDAEGPFIWGVWCSLSEKSYRRVRELWDDAGQDAEPPFFGWLSNTLPLYPETSHLKTKVHLRSSRQRPFVELEPTDHLLAVEQRLGIKLDQVQKLVGQLMHPLNGA